MSGGLWLGLDLGTTSTRALLVEPGGGVLARAARPLPTAFPAPDRVEQDAGALVERSVEVLREALARAGRTARDVSGLGLTTQRSTALAWDARSGRALAPAIGWQDGRTAERVAELRAEGIPITTLPTATKLEWWLRHDDAVRAAASSGALRLGTPDSWLTWHLTGGDAHVTEPGEASCTGLYDLAGGAWSAAALRLFSVDAAALAEVVGTCDVVGETPAALLGAPVPVAARAGDQQAASFAQGVRRPGDAKLTLGTAAMLDVHTGASPAEPAPGSYALALWRLPGAGDAFCLEGSVITAGAAVDWLVSLGVLPDAASLDRVAGDVASCDGVAFVPALQGLGTPHLDDAARGLLGGLTRGTERGHLARAAIDGIAHRCVDVCEAVGLDDRPLRVDGGLARSDHLVQRLADLGGRAVLRANETETTALGAAGLAAVGCGAGLDDAPPVAAERIDPDPANDSTREALRARWAERVARALR